ncbi:squamosa promoter-binding-like protein 16 [Musa acuminata AAA Group]|uniref:(wild Malaysian banana) hypothetical protein n=1 Tax=Musa acuminata subsp. malaccensis TaxID=214687 RepID=A0A804K7E4_MUSAM|nr:PREDICTED: squamosa promoter-binding-like protein 16 [Musa acuminata subsp. malaccensis]CAG1831775.1 unnamed protein product [Musa acuminata subsp. malaccensis]
MDWDLRTPPWNLAELDRDAELSIGSVVVGPSGGGLGCRSTGVDFSVDLKLGGLGDFGSSHKCTEQPTVATSTVSPSGPPKRPRAPVNGCRSVSCLVDGCTADLSNCREYHRRHKVCEVHSKTPLVMVRGQEQRFCQQCSRFHLLEEFDEAKRSCRKRLDGHNRRRRKPQPDSVNSGSLFLDHQGFSAAYPQIFPVAAPESNWARMVKTEDGTLYAPSQFINHHQHFPNSSYSISKERRQMPFFQDSKTVLDIKSTPQVSVDQLNLSTNTPSGSSGCNSKMFNEGLTRVFNSDCALSLLSSPTQTSDINLSHMMPLADRIPTGQPIVSCLQYGSLMQYFRSQASENVTPTGFSCAGMEGQHTGTVLVSDRASDAEINCQNIFHVLGEGSSDATCQTLPFSWH